MKPPAQKTAKPASCSLAPCHAALAGSPKPCEGGSTPADPSRRSLAKADLLARHGKNERRNRDQPWPRGQHHKETSRDDLRKTRRRTPHRRRPLRPRILPNGRAACRVGSALNAGTELSLIARLRSRDVQSSIKFAFVMSDEIRILNSVIPKAHKTPSFNGLSPASELASRTKRNNRRSDTLHEILLRRELWRSGLRFRKNVENMPGKPDIVLSKSRLIVFCDGDFWHGRDWSKLKKKLTAGTNAKYWRSKIESNIIRDRRNTALLQKQGWTVMRLWESEIKRDPFAAAARVRQKIHALPKLGRENGKKREGPSGVLRFVDLFSGLGGFHLALSRLGHKCVFASELNRDLRGLYSRNFGITPVGDIRDIGVESVPEHDVLCAGFPCQPFSKAGSQRGFDCPKWGDLFDRVLLILRERKPEYLILENVPNLERHDGGTTWRVMQKMLKEEGYHIHARRLSPHKFGIPQIRERLFIVGSRTELASFFWPEERSGKSLSILSALSSRPSGARNLSKQVTKCLHAWQDFLNQFPKDVELPSFPIWSMEFGATYPYKHTTPHAQGSKKLGRFRGTHGTRLSQVPPRRRMRCLPSYARVKQSRFPKWKVDFIRQNRDFYRRHQKIIDEWLPKILEFPPSLQKFEWNCKGAKRNVWNLIIQFRASGVRVKRPTTAPSLIAMTTTQVPIIGWQKRYMLPRECARLQSMHELTHLPDSPTAAFKALGNAVNADLVELVLRALLPGPSASLG